MADGRGDPGLEPGLLDELFPLERAPLPRGRRERRIARALGHGRSPRGGGREPAAPSMRPVSPPAPDPPAPDPPDDDRAAASSRRARRSAPERPGWRGVSMRQGWRRAPERPGGRGAAVVGLACAVVALVVRSVLARFVPVGDLHHLSIGELGLGALVVAVVTGWCARAGVPVAVCVAGALALSSIDLGAPVGIGLVLVALVATRRR